MTASRHRQLARTGGHPPRRAPVSKRYLARNVYRLMEPA